VSADLSAEHLAYVSAIARRTRSCRIAIGRNCANAHCVERHLQPGDRAAARTLTGDPANGMGPAHIRHDRHAKMVVHACEPDAAIQSSSNPQSQIVWGTFYDIRRYAGADLLPGYPLAVGSLCLERGEPIGRHLERLASCGVTASLRPRRMRRRS